MEQTKLSFHDHAFSSTDRAIEFEKSAKEYFQEITKDFYITVKASQLIKRLGNVVRTPSWFHFEPSH